MEEPNTAAVEQPLPTLAPESQSVTQRVLLDLARSASFAQDSGQKERASTFGLIAQDMLARNALGISTYGTELMTHNGRDALLDAYQELLDAVKYYRQYLMEKGVSMDLNYGLLLDTLCSIKTAAVALSPVRAGPVNAH